MNKKFFINGNKLLFNTLFEELILDSTLPSNLLHINNSCLKIYKIVYNMKYY